MNARFRPRRAASSGTMACCTSLPRLAALLLLTLPAVTVPLPCRAQAPASAPAGNSSARETDGAAAELLQARSLVRSMEYTLDLIPDKFPALAAETEKVRTAWRSSPFAKGAAAIEDGLTSRGDADIRRQAAETLRAADRKLEAAAQSGPELQSEEAARAFLQLVTKRSQGAIEPAAVRAALLWQCPAYQEKPEAEWKDGYRAPVSFTSPDKVALQFQMPLSWKQLTRPDGKGLDFLSSWGHGPVWLAVEVKPSTDAAGKPVPAAAAHEAATQESSAEEYGKLGITLRDFRKTTVNGMPAIVQTLVAPLEQGGRKFSRATLDLQIYQGLHLVSVQLQAMAPEGLGQEALRRALNFRALFDLIGASFTAGIPDPDALKKAEETFAQTRRRAAVMDAATGPERLKFLLEDAEKGEPQAQMAVAYTYAEGKGVPQDDAAALPWLRKAADQSLPEAQYLLGQFYAAARGGLKEDLTAAFQWWQRAAGAGHPAAAHDLGICYRDGVGTTANPAEAVKWFRKSAEAGLASGQLNLGLLMCQGRGIKADGAAGFDWILKAALQGLPAAQTTAGLMYGDGKVVRQDPIRAHAWLTLATSGGNADGAVALRALSKALTPSELAASLRLAQEFVEKIQAAEKAQSPGPEPRAR